MDLCRDRQCYLQFKGCQGWPTVPAHSNRLEAGRGIGMKSHDIYTLPSCPACHYELDYGKHLDRAEKQIRWEAAYRRWEYDRWAEGLVRVSN
jgi:hypothetical protein